MALRRALSVVLLFGSVSACSGSDPATADDAGTGDAMDDSATDTSTPTDGAPDTGAPADGATDTGSPTDTGAVDAPPDAPPPSGKWVMGYYVGYERALYPAAEIDFTAITHLAIGRITPRADGSLNETFDIDATSGPAMAKDLVTRAHAAGRKAILMLGGAGEHAGWVGAASPARRATFVKNLLAARDAYKADGFDLDWEPIEAGDQANLVALAKDLRAAWPTAILTAPAGWVTMNAPAVDPTWPELAKVVDQINLMSYGMAGPWGGWQSWHSSALIGESASMPSSVDVSVKNYLKAGVPAAKLGVGIGFYGSCWRGVNAVRMPITGASLVADDGKMSFANIMTSYYQAAAYHYDAAAKAPWLGFSTQTGPEKCNLVTYEDATSLADKGKYVRDNGLGGAIIWTINQGHLASAPVGSRDPLLAAVKKAFLD